MVIGNGMVAQKFTSYSDNDQFVIFASGISNSKTLDPKAYSREKELLQKIIQQHKEKILVYFSTCSVYDPGEKNARYVIHKKETEQYIQKHVKQYTIFRVSNLVGKSSNPNTILNFFTSHIANKINFDLWNKATRNLIDIDDMFKLVDHILRHRLFLNQIINIANPKSYPAKKIIAAIEAHWEIRATYVPIPKGNHFEIDISSILPVIRDLGIHFGKDYLVNLLQKYYLRQ